MTNKRYMMVISDSVFTFLKLAGVPFRYALAELDRCADHLTRA
jgi:hypothetical protein